MNSAGSCLLVAEFVGGCCLNGFIFLNSLDSFDEMILAN
jgi:hypothetical protein